MIKGKSVLAIITARGGSKGLPGKNILPLGDKPLIAWTIDEAKKSEYIDRLILSTDNNQIAEVSKKYGCEVPFIRPAKLATDEATSIQVIDHAINYLPEKYDYLVLLQPTSPFRKADDIDACIEKSNFHNTSCVSVCEPEKSPYWMYKISHEGFLEPVIYADATRRQDLPKTYALNGAIYVAETNSYLSNRGFINNETIPYIMPKIRSVDIDNEIDFLLCEALITNNFI